MKTNKHKWNWMMDATLLAGFLATFFLDLTGLVAHQWLGMAVGWLAITWYRTGTGSSPSRTDSWGKRPHRRAAITCWMPV